MRKPIFMKYLKEILNRRACVIYEDYKNMHCIEVFGEARTRTFEG